MDLLPIKGEKMGPAGIGSPNKVVRSSSRGAEGGRWPGDSRGMVPKDNGDPSLNYLDGLGVMTQGKNRAKCRRV